MQTNWTSPLARPPTQETSPSYVIVHFNSLSREGWLTLAGLPLSLLLPSETALKLLYLNSLVRRAQLLTCGQVCAVLCQSCAPWQQPGTRLGLPRRIQPCVCLQGSFDAISRSLRATEPASVASYGRISTRPRAGRTAVVQGWSRVLRS